LHNVRPHKLFNLVKSSSYLDRTVQMVLPDQRTPVLLDTAILLALAKLVRAQTIFEFGTYLGIQTLNLAANFPEARIYTLDLDEASFQGLEQDVNDKPLTRTYLEYQAELAFLNTPYEKRITRLYGDSNRYNFSGLAKQMDLIYVDGGHDPVTLDSDTKNAFSMISQGHAACIAWHDHGNPLYPQVKEYLGKLSESEDLFHVEESWTTFFLHGSEDLVAQLKS
jgi:predicted O-methyltransferase YrrM